MSPEDKHARLILIVGITMSVSFAAIVLGGARAANGMASFADVLSPEQAEAIHHYLIARANQDWAADQ